MSINTQAVVLQLLLKSSQDSDTILDFDAAKPQYFSDSYRTIRAHIASFHEDYGRLPSITDLRVKYSRSSTILATLDALERNELPEEVELEVAVDTLRDEYAQQLTLQTIQKELLPNMTIMSSDELVEKMSAVQLAITEALDSSEKVFTSTQLRFFEDEEDAAADMTITGVSERWDGEFGGTRTQELVLIGGKRGSGKSVISMNMARAQWDIGNVGPYCTIEMNAVETNQRCMASIAQACAMSIRNKVSSPHDVLLLVKARADMFEGGAELLAKYLEEYEIDTTTCKASDFAELDTEMMRLPGRNNPVILIDDRSLTIASIDAHLTALKAKHGDKLKMAVVDYVNQVIVGDKADMYDWKDQLVVSKALKDLARKHEITIVSPYQIDDNGEARLSKAILDPADYAMVIKKLDKYGIIVLEASKVRSISDVTIAVPMDWNTLTLSSEDIATRNDSMVGGHALSGTATNYSNIC
ncbi:DnaB-like replicative helicase [Vibrio phage D245]